jgi:hypothetical protein
MGQFKAASPSVAQAPGNGIALVPADAASVDDDARPVALLDGFRSRLFVMHVRCMQKKGMRPVVGCGALRGGLGCRTAPPPAPGRRHCETLCRRWDRCRASRMSINSKVGVDELAKVTTHVQRRLKGVLGLATVAASGLTGCGSGAADTTVGVYIISAEQPRVTAIATLRRGSEDLACSTLHPSALLAPTRCVRRTESTCLSSAILRPAAACRGA